ncbi:MAG TPA: vWA domain-containing protein [Polyangiaceae bacterium]
MSRSHRLAFGIALCASLELHCGSQEHPPAFVLPQGGGSSVGGSGDGVGGLDISSDAGLDAALCGSQQIPAITDPPNLYFVVDRSGSMAEILPGSTYSKYENARIAISVMLRAVGHRVRYGAAVYPALVDPDGCAPGAEVFPTTSGDPPTFAAKGENGPILSRLLRVIGNLVPNGGTPTAATLRGLQSTVIGLPGKKTYVILMTDGAPNCNVNLTCGPDACIPNIEHESWSGTNCDINFNCCDPKKVGESGIGYCVDADATEAAVAEYEAAGVDTYVLGMPGSEAYADMLGRLATAGNTARPGNTPYYAVSDTNQLSEALQTIGAHVAITCDLPLASAPTDPNLVNVYFDDQLVPSSDTDGWRYTGEKSIQFTGDACATLSSGNVLNVQVLEGCPTVVR